MGCWSFQTCPVLPPDQKAILRLFGPVAKQGMCLSIFAAHDGHHFTGRAASTEVCILQVGLLEPLMSRLLIRRICYCLTPGLHPNCKLMHNAPLCFPLLQARLTNQWRGRVSIFFQEQTDWSVQLQAYHSRLLQHCYQPQSITELESMMAIAYFVIEQQAILFTNHIYNNRVWFGWHNGTLFYACSSWLVISSFPYCTPSIVVDCFALTSI